MSLNGLLDEIATLLRSVDIGAETYVPNSFTLPIAIIEPAEPYIRRISYGNYAVRIAVTLWVEPWSNATNNNELNGLIEKAIVVLDGSVEEVGEPRLYRFNDQDSYLGTTFIVETQITHTELGV